MNLIPRSGAILRVRSGAPGQRPSRRGQREVVAAAAIPANSCRVALAAVEGDLGRVGIAPHYGKIIDVDAGNGHGTGLFTGSGYAPSLSVKGVTALPGQRIPVVGSTGRRTGPHPHIEIRSEDVAHDAPCFPPAAN